MNTKDPNRYYQYLGVSPWASQEEIKKAYRRLAKKCHPDSLTPDSEEFRRLTVIYRTLSDEEGREDYNSTPDGHLFVDELVKEFLQPEPEETVDSVPEFKLPQKGEFFDYSSIRQKSTDREEAQEWYRLLLLALRYTSFRRSFKVCLIEDDDQMGYTHRPPTFFVKRDLDPQFRTSVAWTLAQLAGTPCFS